MGDFWMTSSRFRSFPEARRTSSLPAECTTARPTESSPRYPSFRSPSTMTGTTLLEPMYPTIPHMLFDDLEAVFLDDRIGENFPGNFLQLALGLFAGPAIEIKNKKFALANVGDGGVTEPGEGVLNGLTLRIENRALWHDPNVSFHGESIARQL